MIDQFKWRMWKLLSCSLSLGSKRQVALQFGFQRAIYSNRILVCAQKIGESYRGYVENEVQLDLLLTYHKQQTNSFWGTRQSPSPAKPSTRLMWKSQYVPFDGIPFVNVGESKAPLVSWSGECVCVCV